MSDDSRYVEGVFPLRAKGPLQKVTKLAARVEREEKKQIVRDKEDRNKTAARKRDGWMCRFPRCVCHALKLHPEVAHVVSKGIGGDKGTRSHVSQLICLCKPRHQESRISFHAGTLKVKALTGDGMNGPVAWLVNVTALDSPTKVRPVKWVVVAEESAVRILAPLTKEQSALLARIAELRS